MPKSKELITTAIAYANGAPHIGHAFEFVTGDVIARFARIHSDVFFITGMDEHGQKIEEKAKESNLTPQEFVDTNARQFKEIDDRLGISYDYFVRTSDKEKHYKGAQALWNKLKENDDLEKRIYAALYCVGCEEFKHEGDLNEKGECPLHLKKPEVVEEENYFFKLSKYQDRIKSAILDGSMQIYPESRKNEIVALIDRGLEDVSFSRPRTKVSWGIPVPSDDTQVMYVWCDALSNYITAIGYGTETFDEERWKNTTHVIGKDILRFHAAIWPGMLLSAGLDLPKRILVHGHITSGGQKMSKTLGNVIDPDELFSMFEGLSENAGEIIRFILLHEIPAFEDGDLTIDSIRSAYSSHLANGIGNLTSRVMKMATSYGVVYQETKAIPERGHVEEIMKTYDAKKALEYIMTKARAIDNQIATEEPFKVFKIDEPKAKEIVMSLLGQLYAVAGSLEPFMPHTSAKILECIRENKMPEKPIFNRLL